MDFPTSAAYPMSYDDTASLLSEMQRQASEVIDASRDEYDEGYEINMMDDLGTFEISATDTYERSVGVSCERSMSERSRKVKQERGRSGSKPYSKCTDGYDTPLSPHIDVDAPLSPVEHMTTAPLSIMDPPAGQDPTEYEDSILDTLSDLEDGVDHELGTGKWMLNTSFGVSV
jgi:hypothetical protein